MPQGLERTTSLTTFRLKLINPRVNWEPLLNSLGNCLEYLNLGEHLNLEDLDGTSIPSGSLASILSSNSHSLQVLCFHNIKCEEDQVQVNWCKSFPSLNPLPLLNIQPLLLKYLETAESPRLQKLELGCYGRSCDGFQESFECLLAFCRSIIHN